MNQYFPKVCRKVAVLGGRITSTSQCHKDFSQKAVPFGPSFRHVETAKVQYIHRCNILINKLLK